MDFSILSRSTSSSMLSVLASWYTWESSCTAAVSVTSRPVLSWVGSTLRLLLCSDERVWFASVSTGRPVLSEELSSSLKELTLISWERDVFLSSCMSSGRPDLSRIGLRIGWFAWKLLDSCPTSGRWSLSMFWTQFSFPFVFQGDLWWRPRWHVYWFENDFSSFHPNNFSEYNKQEVFLKDACIRPNLMEFQSFLLSKFDVDPIHRVLMLPPCCMYVPCKTRCFQVDRLRILVIFVHRIHMQKEYCLSFAQTLTSRY